MQLKIKILFVFALLLACNTRRKQTNLAKDLNDSVVNLTKHYKDTIQFENAITLLNQAAKIDSNYFETYKNKLFFEESLGQFDKAAATLTRMIKMKPDSADLYLKLGLYKDAMGDSLAAVATYNRSLPRYTILLDTMSSDHPERRNVMNMLSINITMLGQEKMLRDLSNQNLNPKPDSFLMPPPFLIKTRKEILDAMQERYKH